MTPKTRLRPRAVRRLPCALDGAPVYSCTLPASAVENGHVETSAGLDTPVRRVLVEANATQCGYCLPGIVRCRRGAVPGQSTPVAA